MPLPGLASIRTTLPPPPAGDDEPRVKPGGTFGLNLTEAQSLGTVTDAATALGRIKSAISMTQTAYRSLYWDDMKANLVNGSKGGAGNGAGFARIQAQMSNYQAALTRLAAGPSSTLGF